MSCEIISKAVRSLPTPVSSALNTSRVNMALRDLVEGECGGANSLVRLTTHFVQDRAHKEEGLRHHFPQHSAENFAESTCNQEMREIESTRQCSLPPIPAPGVAEALADPASACWAEQFLEPSKQFDDQKIEAIWNDSVNSQAGMLGGQNELGFGPSWTLEYLESDETALPRELENAWKEGSTDNSEIRAQANELVSSIDDPKITYSKEYTFEKENPLKDHEDPLEEGKRRLAAGDLPSAVLLFEAAVQKDEASVEAWQLLGTTQAENEQDPAAIPALKKCLQLDPTNLTALMALSVCYTNENYQNQACHALKEWLKANPKYSGLVPEGSPEHVMPKIGSITSLLTGDIHKEVHDLFLSAARINPSGDLDPEIQCGLGVLMWNRLGATLANGNRSEEAVEAYHRALELSPGFIRARYNVGITCVNLGAHREAAEHLLTALNQQASGKGPQGKKSWASMSDSIWSTLRLVVSLMDRKDLFPSIENRDLPKLNEEFGMD
ncbi:hypothetical protein B566_EDAN002799 [Ephemera danica]|nr:hypothetical protein B566_EDAN002799 [Ephemera danica]